MSPSVSIVVPVRDGMATLEALTDAIAQQTLEYPVETVAVDSGSVDGSRDFLERRFDRVIDVPSAEFNHGETRNVGIRATTGDLIVLLVQDAIPVGNTWLEELIRPLLGDERVAGTWARQSPRPDASAIARHYLEGWLGARRDECRRVLPSQDALDVMTPEARHAFCAFDNVCSCLRRSVWERHPLPATAIAEDLEWAKTVLLAGHHLVYAPRATVIHSHDRGPDYELARTTALHRRLNALFGLRTLPRKRDLPRAIASTLALHARLIARDPRPGAWSPREVARGMLLAVAWPLGQYLGGRAPERGVGSAHAGGV